MTTEANESESQRRKPRPRGRLSGATIVLILLSCVGPNATATLATVEVEGLSGLGDNGYIVDPLIIEVQLSTPSESCGGEVLLPNDIANLATYCGDVDGCRARLVSLGSKRSQSRPVVMTTDATGTVWTRSTTDGEAVIEGDVTDGSTASILAARSSDFTLTCIFTDSAVEASYGIVNCFDDSGMADDSGNHTCTLVIHD